MAYLILRIVSLFIGPLSLVKRESLARHRTAQQRQILTRSGWPDAPESVAGSDWNGWPDQIGILGRMVPECAPGVGLDLTRIDASQNVHRFYRMGIVRGLFGDWSLVREWGRIGQRGQVRVDWYETEAAAKDARFDIQMKKAKRGYE